MDYCNLVSGEYNRFNAYLKNTLNNNTPSHSKHSLYMGTPPSTDEGRLEMYDGIFSSIGFLATEVFCRTTLLFDRCLRTAFSGNMLVVSCASPTLNIILPTQWTIPTASQSWERFSHQARHLSADLFEMVGVIVCLSFIILSKVIGVIYPPLGKRVTNILLSLQEKCEKTAELISGEHIIIDIFNRMNSHIRKKKETLSEAMRLSNISDEERENWLDEIIELEQLLYSRTAPLEKRRISRDLNPSSFPLETELNVRLNNMSDIISDKITALVIPQQKEKTSFLYKLMGKINEENSDMYAVDDSSSIDHKLKVFQDLQLKIELLTSQLQQIHDPDQALAREIKELNIEVSKAFNHSFNDAMRQLLKHGGLEGCFTKVRHHFFSVNQKLSEVNDIYSFQNLFELNPEINDRAIENLSGTLKSSLREKIDFCKVVLQDTTISWASGIFTSYDSLDRSRSLKILGLEEGATNNKIKKTYHRLCLKHHPDKGGNEDHFKIICRAYIFLLP